MKTLGWLLEWCRLQYNRFLLDSKPKHTDNAEHGLVFPSDCTWTIWWIIPETRAGSVETSSILLHDNTRHNIFERLSKLGKLVEALLYNIGGPLVDFVVLVGVTSNGSLHSFLDDVGHFIYNKCCLFPRLKVIHGCFVFVYLQERCAVSCSRKNSRLIPCYAMNT